MDKLEKEFKNLDPKEQRQIEEIFARLKSGHFKGLDIKKLKGSDDAFRVRKGNIRVIYRVKDKQIVLIHISRRSEKTYRGF